MKIKWKETIAVNIINFITSDKYLIKFIRSQNDKKKNGQQWWKNVRNLFLQNSTHKKNTHTHAWNTHLFFIFSLSIWLSSLTIWRPIEEIHETLLEQKNVHFFDVQIQQNY